MAAPGKLERMMRRKELPSVWAVARVQAVNFKRAFKRLFGDDAGLAWQCYRVFIITFYIKNNKYFFLAFNNCLCFYLL